MTVYDATIPAGLERTNGPANPRLIHAFPAGSDIALCGALRAHEAQPRSGWRCKQCEHEAGRKSWVTRG